MAKTTKASPKKVSKGKVLTSVKKQTKSKPIKKSAVSTRAPPSPTKKSSSSSSQK